MNCEFQDRCGGCVHRHLSEKEYQNRKRAEVSYILQNLETHDFKFAEPVFIGDGTRRRASFAFEHKKGQLILGFNQHKSDTVVDVKSCALLTPKINDNLENIRQMLLAICEIAVPVMKKNKQVGVNKLDHGDVLITQAANGLDVVLEFAAELNLDYRMTLFEQSQSYTDIIRISHRQKELDKPETIIEKTKPFIDIAGYEVYIPAGTFLQASDASEQALIKLVMGYLGDTQGKIADLFCGVGTFSYPLSRHLNNKILAVDSSPVLLEGFQFSINKNMIPNITLKDKNLFKYPLDEKELKNFAAIVIDPPRAGAAPQMQKLIALNAEERPTKIISVSCNPHSFVKDANVLINGGYHLQEITLVDQFIYSNHSELVALFTK